METKEIITAIKTVVTNYGTVDISDIWGEDIKLNDNMSLILFTINHAVAFDGNLNEVAIFDYSIFSDYILNKILDAVQEYETIVDKINLF